MAIFLVTKVTIESLVCWERVWAFWSMHVYMTNTALLRVERLTSAQFKYVYIRSLWNILLSRMRSSLITIAVYTLWPIAANPYMC